MHSLRFSPPVVAVLLALAPAAHAQLPTDTTTRPGPELALLNNAPVPAECARPFGLGAGQRLEYQLLDSRGKLTGVLRYQVVSLSSEIKGQTKKPYTITTLRLKSGLYDAASHVQQQQDLVIVCKHDTTYTDGLAEINYNGLKSFDNRRFAYQSKPLAWPNQPTTGTALPEGGVVVQVSSPSVAITKVKTTLKSRKVGSGLVMVAVPAGSFNCYTVESQRELATAARADLVLQSTGRQVDYYAPAVGIVKTEYYDKGGKLQQTRVLARR